MEIAPAGERIWPGAVLGLPVESFGTDRVVVVSDAIVVTLALVQSNEE